MVAVNADTNSLVSLSTARYCRPV